MNHRSWIRLLLSTCYVCAMPATLVAQVSFSIHGQFSSGGLSNEENPLAFVDLDDGSYFQFISNTESSVGHLDGLLSTSDSLFVADLSPGGGLGSSNGSTGKIYQIQAIAAPLPGDFDDDGDVDGADFLLWQQGGSPAGLSQADLNDWKSNYGAPSSSPLTHSASVPEPGSVVLALFMGVLIGPFLGRRKLRILK